MEFVAIVLKWISIYSVASVMAASGGIALVLARHEWKYGDAENVPPISRSRLKRNAFIGWFCGISAALIGSAFGYRTVEWTLGLACIGGFFNQESAQVVPAVIKSRVARWLGVSS